MRTRFGPQDEDAFYAAREELMASYAASPGGPPDEDTFVASLMLTYKWSHGDGRILHWTWHDLETLLLDYFPAKVTLDSHEIESVTPDAAAFLGFLDQRGLLTGDSLARLRSRLDELASPFRAAMRDTSRFGLAKRLVAQMGSEQIDPTEPGAMDAWLDDVNARTSDERDDILGLWDTDPGPLPAIQLTTDGSLAEAASASSTLDRLTAFTRYVEQPRKLTKLGHLSLADGKAVAGVLGVPDEFDPAVGSMVFRTRTTEQMPRVSESFRWARAAGFVKVRHGWLSATQRGRKLGSKPSEDWLAAFEAYVEGAVFGGLGRGGQWDEVHAELMVPLTDWLYRTGGLEVTLVQDVALELAEERFYLPEPDAPNDPRKWIRNSVDWRVIEPLQQLGALTVVDGTVSLTPLGQWATHRRLRARGILAPIVGELTGSAASELLTASAHWSADDAELEIRRWIDARPDSAAQELADAARSRETSILALHALGFVGPSAEPAVRRMLDVPALRPGALLWLVQQGYESSSSLPPEVQQIMVIETLIGLNDRGDPDAMVQHVQALGPEDEQIRFIEGWLRTDHPRTTEVLLAIGRLHPSKAVAKTARKVAFQRQGIRPH